MISDNADTAIGMRLAGFEGEVIRDRVDILKRLTQLIEEPEVAIVLMTTGVIGKVADVVSQYKLTLSRPLIVEIPDRDGSSGIGQTINRYVSEAIGVKL